MLMLILISYDNYKVEYTLTAINDLMSYEGRDTLYGHLLGLYMY